MKYLTTKERLSFTVAAFGRSGIYTLMSMFVLRFFTDAVGISSIAAGYIILAGIMSIKWSIMGQKVGDCFDDRDYWRRRCGNGSGFGGFRESASPGCFAGTAGTGGP